MRTYIISFLKIKYIPSFFYFILLLSCAWYWWTKWTAKINAMSWSGLCVFVWCPSDRKPMSTQVNSGSLWSLPPPRSHCIPSSSGWGASSEHSPPPSWKREDMRRRQGRMFWASWKHPTNLEWIKKGFVHLENICASQRGVWPQRSRGSASTSQTSSRNLEDNSFRLVKGGRKCLTQDLVARWECKT